MAERQIDHRGNFLFEAGFPAPVLPEQITSTHRTAALARIALWCCVGGVELYGLLASEVLCTVNVTAEQGISWGECADCKIACRDHISLQGKIRPAISPDAVVPGEDL